MRNPIFEKITQAIDEYRLLLLTDAAGPRLIEPYLIFESPEGDMLLHGWQQAGAFRQTPPPRWCNLPLDAILAAQVLAEQFVEPHRGYNPQSDQFYRVLYELRGNTIVESPPPIPNPRIPRERRGPPGGHSERLPRSRHNRWDFRG